MKAAEGVKTQGMIRIKKYKAGTLDRALPHLRAVRGFQNSAAVATSKELPEILRYQKEAQRFADEIMAEGFLELAVECPNLVMQGTLTGKDLLVQYLCAAGMGATIYAGINWCAIGTGVTAPAITDTQLTTETARVAIALAIDSGNNVAELQFFFTDALLANGTYKEIGTFMNGTAAANSGKIFNHSLLGTSYVKTTGVDTTVEVDITLT